MHTSIWSSPSISIIIFKHLIDNFFYKNIRINEQDILLCVSFVVTITCITFWKRNGTNFFFINFFPISTSGMWLFCNLMDHASAGSSPSISIISFKWFCWQFTLRKHMYNWIRYLIRHRCHPWCNDLMTFPSHFTI